jgi:hypothetical protein
VIASTGRLCAVPTPSSAATRWAPAPSATVHPGVQLYTGRAQCTANFVFTSGIHVYVGQAAHCSAMGESDLDDGCVSASLPLGTSVDIRGARRPGRIVYSSWLTMQALHETDADACRYNDVELVEVDPSDAGSVNPSIPVWGGPVGISPAGTVAGDPIYGYGNSELAMGRSDFGSKEGISLGDNGGGWSHAVLTGTPGIPGDSGSAYLDSQGRALGILSTLDLVPVPGSNGVGDLSRELDYLRAHSALGSLQLALGTEPFATRRAAVGRSSTRTTVRWSG